MKNVIRVAIEIELSKDIKDLPQHVVGRVYTMDGVESVKLVSVDVLGAVEDLPNVDSK